MEILDLKKQIDNLVEENRNQKELREKITEKYKTFLMISDVLAKKVEKAVKDKKEELFSQFKYFFGKNGFKIANNKDNEITMEYNGANITLADKNSENLDNNLVITFKIPLMQKHYEIVIKVCHKDADMLRCKNHLQYGEECINESNYSAIVQQIDEIDQLKSLLAKIEENNNWFNETLKKFKNIQFVYSLQNSDKEYRTFEELFKDLD